MNYLTKNISISQLIKQYLKPRVLGYGLLAGTLVGPLASCSQQAKSTVGDAIHALILGNVPQATRRPTPVLISNRSTPTNGATNVTANTSISLIYELGPNFDTRIASTLSTSGTINGVAVSASDVSVSLDTTAGEMTITINNPARSNYSASPSQNKYKYYNYSPTTTSVSLNVSFDSPYLATPATATSYSFTMGLPKPVLSSCSVSNFGTITVGGTIDCYFTIDTINDVALLATISGSGYTTPVLNGATILPARQVREGNLNNPAVPVDTIRISVNTLGAITAFPFTNGAFAATFSDAGLNGTVSLNYVISGTTGGLISYAAPTYTPVANSGTYNPATGTIQLDFNAPGLTPAQVATLMVMANEITIGGTAVLPADVALSCPVAGVLRITISNPNRTYINYAQSFSVYGNLSNATFTAVFTGPVTFSGYTNTAIADPRPSPTVIVSDNPANSVTPIGPATTTYTRRYTIPTLSGAGAAAAMRFRIDHTITGIGSFSYSYPAGVPTVNVSWAGGNDFDFTYTPVIGAGANANGNFWESATHTLQITFLDNPPGTLGNVKPQTMTPSTFVRDSNPGEPVFAFTSSSPADNTAVAGGFATMTMDFTTTTGVPGDEANMLANLTALVATDGGGAVAIPGGELNIISLGGNAFRLSYTPAGTFPAATHSYNLSFTFGAAATLIAPVTYTTHFSTF